MTQEADRHVNGVHAAASGRGGAARLLPVLAERVSASHFSVDHVVDEDTVDVLLDAARRAPSAGNSQPWAFIVGRRGDAVHARLVARLATSTGRWAPQAGVLIANLAHLQVEGTDMEYSEFAHYDLGQAVAHLTVQAQALGLSVHQFRAFDREGITADFAVPGHWEVTTLSAIGTPVPERGRRPPLGTAASSTGERRDLLSITWARDRSG